MRSRSAYRRARDSAYRRARFARSLSSKTAPLTRNQAEAFPVIEESGATVVSKEKIGFLKGTEIPPTRVDIIRPNKVNLFFTDLQLKTTPVLQPIINRILDKNGDLSNDREF